MLSGRGEKYVHMYDMVKNNRTIHENLQRYYGADWGQKYDM